MRPRAPTPVRLAGRAHADHRGLVPQRVAGGGGRGGGGPVGNNTAGTVNTGGGAGGGGVVTAGGSGIVLVKEEVRNPSGIWIMNDVYDYRLINEWTV